MDWNKHNGKSAQVKKTGDILTINECYKAYNIGISLKYDNSEFESMLNLPANLPEIKIDYLIDQSTSNKGTIYYRLSDGKSYKKSELIIGEDKIRDIKLKKLLDGSK
jgi:hypothetical protein